MKQALRQSMRAKRKTLTQASYAEKSKKIRQTLEALPEFKNAEKILIYVSNKEEVDTHALIQDLLKKKRPVFVPKVRKNQLTVCRLHEWKDLEPGSFGILEPCTILKEAEPQSMDLIVVPGLAFDPRGHRIGYGKGFYDRLLKGTRGYKVGLAFHEQIVENVPEEAHDVPLDLIITDLHCTKCSPDPATA